MSEEPFKLLIMDSITANMRVDYSGRGELAERQQKLGQLMNRLRKVRGGPGWRCEVGRARRRGLGCLRMVTGARCALPVGSQHFTFDDPSLSVPAVQIADEFNVAVVITNQVMSDPSGGAMFVSDPKKPVGGHVMAHASTVRLSARKGKGEQRLIKVVDAPNVSCSLGGATGCGAG